jgi:hypothetical protein
LLIAVLIVSGVLLAILVLNRRRGWRLGWSARAVEVIELQINEREAAQLVDRSIAAFDLTDGPIRHRQPQTIEATMRGDGSAFGNSVEVRIERLGPALTRLQITSNSIVPQLWDWGRSRSIVSRIAADILARSA